MKVRYASEQETDKMINEWLQGSVGPMDLIKAPLTIGKSFGKGMLNAFSDAKNAYKSTQRADMRKKLKANSQEATSNYNNQAKEQTPVVDNKVVNEPPQTQEEVNNVIKTEKNQQDNTQEKIKKVQTDKGEGVAKELYGDKAVEDANNNVNPQQGVTKANDIVSKANETPNNKANREVNSPDAHNKANTEQTKSNQSSTYTTTTMPKWNTSSTTGQNYSYSMSEAQRRMLKRIIRESIARNTKKEAVNEWLNTGGLAHSLTLPNTRRALEQWGSKVVQGASGNYSSRSQSSKEKQPMFLKIRVSAFPDPTSGQKFVVGIVDEGPVDIDQEIKAEIRIDQNLQVDQTVSFNSKMPHVQMGGRPGLHKIVRGWLSKPGEKIRFGKQRIIVDAYV